MKFTIALFAFLSISSTWAIKAKIEDLKGKRDASGDYSPSIHSSHSYQTPSLSHEDASAISVGAGYSVGGARPSYSYGGQGSGATYQLQSDGLPSSSRQTIQLSPITLQSGHEGLVSNDLSQLMSQLSQGINSGAISIPGGQGVSYQVDSQGLHGGQNSFPQFSYGGQQLSQYSLGEQGQGLIPSYSTSTKGLGTYSSTGPVLFNPGSQSGQQAVTLGAPSSGQSYESFSLGESGHGLQGYSLGGGAQSFGGPLKAYRGNYATSSKSSFRPSAFLGSSGQSDSGHGLSALSGSYTPSFANYQAPSGSFGSLSLGSGAHGATLGSFSGYGGSPKLFAPTKSEGAGSYESIASAFSASGQSISPPGTTYGVPAATYTPSNVHAASVASPQYYASPSKYSAGGFGSSGSSYKGPISSQSSLSSFASGPKYSFGGYSSSNYASPKDIQGAYSEPSYNTIKYSEEFKPRGH